MQSNCNSSKRAGRPGYALLLGLLALFVVGMLFYYKRMHGPVYQIGKGKSDIAVPWRQWHAIHVRTKKGHPPGLPTEDQPQITQTLQVAAEPNEDMRKRGQMTLVILPNGTVQGEWGGQFNINRDVDFQVMACRFNGFVDPEQIYSDELGEDPSKLFFIAKGHFVILETNDDSGKVRKLGGDIYVRGWLGLDNLLKGEVILTADEKNFYLYTWKSKARQGVPSLF